jgi:ubiquitin-protein ligase
MLEGGSSQFIAAGKIQPRGDFPPMPRSPSDAEAPLSEARLVDRYLRVGDAVRKASGEDQQFGVVIGARMTCDVERLATGGVLRGVPHGRLGMVNGLGAEEVVLAHGRLGDVDSVDDVVLVGFEDGAMALIDAPHLHRFRLQESHTAYFLPGLTVSGPSKAWARTRFVHGSFNKKRKSATVLCVRTEACLVHWFAGNRPHHPPDVIPVGEMYPLFNNRRCWTPQWRVGNPALLFPFDDATEVARFDPAPMVEMLRSGGLCPEGVLPLPGQEHCGFKAGVEGPLGSYTPEALAALRSMESPVNAVGEIPAGVLTGLTVEDFEEPGDADSQSSDSGSDVSETSSTDSGDSCQQPLYQPQAMANHAAQYEDGDGYGDEEMDYYEDGLLDVRIRATEWIAPPKMDMVPMGLTDDRWRTVVVTRTDSTVDVLWQDGSVTRGVHATTVLHQTQWVSNEFLPGELVRLPGPPKTKPFPTDPGVVEFLERSKKYLNRILSDRPPPTTEPSAELIDALTVLAGGAVPGSVATPSLAESVAETPVQSASPPPPPPPGVVIAWGEPTVARDKTSIRKTRETLDPMTCIVYRTTAANGMFVRVPSLDGGRPLSLHLQPSMGGSLLSPDTVDDQWAAVHGSDEDEGSDGPSVPLLPSSSPAPARPAADPFRSVSRLSLAGIWSDFLWRTALCRALIVAINDRLGKHAAGVEEDEPDVGVVVRFDHANKIVHVRRVSPTALRPGPPRALTDAQFNACRRKGAAGLLEELMLSNGPEGPKEVGKAVEEFSVFEVKEFMACVRGGDAVMRCSSARECTEAPVGLVLTATPYGRVAVRWLSGVITLEPHESLLSVNTEDQEQAAEMDGVHVVNQFSSSALKTDPPAPVTALTEGEPAEVTDAMLAATISLSKAMAELVKASQSRDPMTLVKSLASELAAARCPIPLMSQLTDVLHRVAEPSRPEPSRSEPAPAVAESVVVVDDSEALKRFETAFADHEWNDALSSLWNCWFKGCVVRETAVPSDFVRASKERAASASSGMIRRVITEVRAMEGALPSGTAVFFYPENPECLRAIIAGAPGTPYAFSLFMFDFTIPGDYPHSPPVVHYHSRVDQRLNPNLYVEGKVCLSLLGTWASHSSEQWQPAHSSLLQVILSIQSIVLNRPFPYFNEPGTEMTEGTDSGTALAKAYNESALLLVGRGFADMLVSPPRGAAGDLVAKHARAAAPRLLSVYAALGDSDATTPDAASMRELLPSPCSEGFRRVLAALRDKIAGLL